MLLVIPKDQVAVAACGLWSCQVDSVSGALRTLEGGSGGVDTWPQFQL